MRRSRPINRLSERKPVLQEYRPARGRKGAVFTNRRRRRHPSGCAVLITIVLLVLLAAGAWWFLRGQSGRAGAAGAPGSAAPSASASIASAAQRSILYASFLGGPRRDTTGKAPGPNHLRVLWKTQLGSGLTQRKQDNKPVLWSGSGWTGQCTVVEDGGKVWLLLGGYDHNLHKIDAATGKVAWQAKWPDVMKGTNTVVANPRPASAKAQDRLIVVSGSRRGSNLSVGDPKIAPLRAVSFATGKELWRLPVPKTDNYSQDVDSSALWYKGVLYCPVESGYLYALDPFRTRVVGGVRQPIVLARSPRLYDVADASKHPDIGGANVAIEASPSAIGNVIYITSGSGHVYGLDRRTLNIVWDFETGSDIDGTPVVTHDGKLLVTIEKQYIAQKGGVYKLDPSKPPAHAVVWYLPLPNRGIAEWAGGSVGSVAMNDADNTGSKPRLAAFTSVDGSVRVVSQDATTTKRYDGPGPGGPAPAPVEVFNNAIGGAISSPAFVGDRIVAAGYDKTVHLYKVRYTAASKGAKNALASPDGRWWRVGIDQIASFTAGGPFESSPLVWKGRVYIGCRDGYLYCLG